MHALAKDLLVTALILVVTFSAIKTFSTLKHLILSRNKFLFLKDERLSRLSRVILLALAGFINIYFVHKGLFELFVGLLYCFLMYSVAVLEAPTEDRNNNDDDFYD